MNSPEFIWLGISILLLIIEAVTVNLVTIWLGLGALGGMVCAMLGFDTLSQILVFAVVSVILLIFTRPLAVKFIRKTPTNSDSLIGRHGVVTKEINNLAAKGEVKINGKYWTARSSEENISIGEDCIVEVISISGVKLIVKQIKEGM